MSATEPDDELLAAALGAGLTYSRAAEVAGVSRATTGRRMADSSFRAQVDRLRRDHVRRVEVRLADLSGRALDALDDLLSDRDAPAQRLGAAKAVLDGVLRFREAADVEDRLAALEARAAGREPAMNGAGR